MDGFGAMHIKYSVVGQLCEINEKLYNMGPLKTQFYFCFLLELINLPKIKKTNKKKQKNDSQTLDLFFFCFVFTVRKSQQVNSFYLKRCTQMLQTSI